MLLEAHATLSEWEPNDDTRGYLREGLDLSCTDKGKRTLVQRALETVPEESLPDALFTSCRSRNGDFPLVLPYLHAALRQRSERPRMFTFIDSAMVALADGELASSQASGVASEKAAFLSRWAPTELVLAELTRGRWSEARGRCAAFGVGPAHRTRGGFSSTAPAPSCRTRPREKIS